LKEDPQKGAEDFEYTKTLHQETHSHVYFKDGVSNLNQAQQKQQQDVLNAKNNYALAQNQGAKNDSKLNFVYD
jgi:hypothetical protein